MKDVLIYTDGSCLGMGHGAGGCAAVMLYCGAQREFSASFVDTTANRMEIMAAILGLERLTEPCKVEILTDSKYVAHAIGRGWMKRWKLAGWSRRSAKAPPESRGGVLKNSDLWKRLDTAMAGHEVRTTWVRGHSGILGNERADELAGIAARSSKKELDTPPEDRQIMLLSDLLDSTP